MVRTDEKNTREGVVLQDDLMNDTRAGLPESDAVLGASRGQKVVHLFVDVLGSGQVLGAADLRLDQVIAVNGRRHLDAWHARRDELKHGHLRRRVLHGYSIGS